MKKLAFILQLMLLMGATQVHAQLKLEHPSLILHESQFEDLREKLTNEPFASTYEKVKQELTRNYEKMGMNELSRQLSSLTLMYAVETDEAVKAACKKQILASMDTWDHITSMMGSDHATTVYGAGAVLNTAIALDMIYNNCTPEELARAEAKVAGAIKFLEIGENKNGRQFQWKLARYGALSAWYAYKQDLANLTYWAERYKHKLLDESLTVDGSWVHSPAYAFARMMGNRIAKSHGIEVLQSIGYHDFFADERMDGFAKWITHFAFTPFGTFTRFGETGGFGDFTKSNPGLYLFANYSKEAAEYAEYYLDGAFFSHNNIDIYILMALTPLERAEAKAPASMLVETGGAALWAKSANRESQQGVLYSMRRDDWGLGGFHHIAADVNSLSISGYGELLLTNCGTSYVPRYPGFAPDGSRWIAAWMQNVITINNEKDHDTPGQGGGLVGGLVGGEVEFGVTNSAHSVSAKLLHTRSLFMVHPQDENSVDDYFVVHDKVNFSYHMEVVNILWQPNTLRGGVKTIRDGELYHAPADCLVTKDRDSEEALSIMIVTPADSVRVKDSYKAIHQGTFETDRIVASYYPNREEHNVKALTILYPENAKHKTPKMDRIGDKNFNGVVINRSSESRDIVIEGENRHTSSFENLQFAADFALFRESAEPKFTVCGGRLFTADIDGEKYGFQCYDTITFQLEGKSGQIVGGSQPITIYHPNAKSIKINGKRPKMLESGDGWVKVIVPKETVTVEFK